MSWRVFGQWAPIYVVACLVASPLSAQEPTEISLSPSADARVSVLVELTGEPAAKVFADALQSTSGRRGGASMAHARRVAHDQFRALEFEQEDAATALSFRFDAREIYRVRRALNALAVSVDSNRIDAIRRLPGVKTVRILETEYTTSSTSMPFLGVPKMWGDQLGLGRSLTGAGIRIGIIDTGIDYQHANFGGTGALADYQANDRMVAPDAYFPNAKVVGGFDFAGDDYNPGIIPAIPAKPDADPMDCNGHGTHVAGIAAGYGVTAAGTTYGGPYDTAAPFGSLRIGPGAAPQALLYALRVFGCTGGTNLTVQAIDWAIDPNGDGDFSDHLDVINLSLGSTYGGATTATALAADNAALAGVIVVASAGNSGDTYFIGGSPGSASRAIATSASADSGLAGGALQVNSPPAIAQTFLAAAGDFTPTPPAPSGQTANVILANDGSTAGSGTVNDGCQPFVNAATVAGKIALVERGVACSFFTKVQNAQAAGAIGVIVANNVPGEVGLVVMQGSGPLPPITIPSVFISQADSAIIRAQPAGSVNVTLVAANAGDTLASFSSRGPSRSTTPFHLKPDVTAPGLSITSSQTGVTCTTGSCQSPNATGYLPDNQTLVLSGTSMATPHMAGIMALLRQLHPDWTVEELKALAMNTALTSPTLGADGMGLKFGPGRVGAGRVQPPDAATSDVVAFDAVDAGVVSVSFDGQILGTAAPAIQTRKIRVVNKGTTAETYTLGIDTVVNAPGIAFSLPGGASLTVPGGETLEFDVQMDAFGALMDRAREASVPAMQAAPSPLNGLGNLSRHWMTEEAGYVTFSQGGILKKRVPVYVAARPASTMRGASTIVTGGAVSGMTSIPLSGSPVCTGTLTGSVCSGSLATKEASLVTPFELQVVSPRDPAIPAYADLQYAGVAFTPSTGLILFGVSTWGNWSTPTDVSFNVYVDFDDNGTWDKILFNSNPGTAALALFGNTAATGLDAFTNAVVTISSGSVSIGGGGNFVNRVAASAADSALFNNHVMFLAATPAQLGLPVGDTTFKYRIVTCPGAQPLCEFQNAFHLDSAAGPYSWNYLAAAQGLNFLNANLSQDMPGASIPVTFNTTNLAANQSLGALLLHHHNREGTAAQVVLVEGSPAADLAISGSAAPASPLLGQNVTLTVTVTNGGLNAATGVVVNGPLPAGLTWVSDDSGGAYNPSTGRWGVGALPNAANASVNIVATVEQTGQQCVPFQITEGTPLDPNPSNNAVNLCVNAPRSADVALTMSASSPTVLAGSTVTFQLRVTNRGEDPAYDITVNEAFAAWPTLDPIAATPSQGIYTSATGSWKLSSLGPGVSATLDLLFVAPNTPGPLTNDGNAASSTADASSTNNAASATVTVVSPPPLARMTVAGTFNPGGVVVYTVTVSNTTSFPLGDNPGNEFVDVLPPSLVLLTASASSGTATANVGTNTVTWDGALAASGSVTITITARIGFAVPGGQLISNQGSVSYDADRNGANESTVLTDDPGQPGAADPTVFGVSSPANVFAAKTAAGTFRPGGTVTYSIVLSNTSATPQFDNPGNELTDVLPASLTLLSASATSGTAVATLATNTVTWNGAVPGSGSVTVTITATISPAATAGQVIANQGTVAYDADGNSTNEASRLTDDPGLPGAADPTLLTVLSPASLSATKTVAGVFRSGGAITYTIVVTNSSSSAQFDNPGNELTDVLPASLTLVGASATSGTATATVATNSVTWSGAVPGSGSVTLTITATISPAATAGQVIANQGTVAYDADGNGTNEASRLTDDPGQPGAADPTTLTVLSPASLSATKTVAGTFRPGGTITYTIALTNSASSVQFDNPGNELTDVLPASLTLVSASATSGTTIATPATNTVAWNGAVAASGSVTITITATISAAAIAGQVIANQGTVAYDADGNGTNEASRPTDDPGQPGAADPTRLTVLSPAILSATKTVAGAFQPGGTITYTIVLTNSSSSAQSDNPGNELADVLPASLTLVGASATSGTTIATPATNTVAWNGAVAASGSVTITITATISAAATAGQVIANQGTVAYDADGNGTNDASRLTDDPGLPGSADPTAFVVLSWANMTATKTASGLFTPGSTVTYTITLWNASVLAQSDNPGNELTDVLPAALTLASASATSGTTVATVATNTVTWNGAIPGGGSVTVIITATLAATATPGQIVTNQGTAAYDADGNGTNESSRVTDDPSLPGWSDPTAFQVLGPPRLAIQDLTLVEGNSGTKAATLTVTLSPASKGPVTVSYATQDGFAQSGSDYLAASGTLTFAPGETSKTIAVSVVGDTVSEDNEGFAVNLGTPAGATLADGQGYVTILDDDTPARPTPRQQALWQDFFAVNGREEPMLGDFDGDGLTDIVTFTRDNPMAVGDVYVALSTATRFGPSQLWHDHFAWNPAETVLTGDFDGDGRTDIATWLRTSTRQVYVSLSTGTAFAPESVWVNGIGTDPTDVVLTGDVNGDGRADLVLFARKQGKVQVALSTGASFLPPTQWHAFFAVSTYERPGVGDFNGDGLADIVTFATDSPTAFGDVYVALSDGSQFGDGKNSQKWHDYFAIRPTEKVRSGDLDGDGKTDLFTFLPPPWGQCYTSQSLGTGLGPSELWREVVVPLATDQPWVGDVNGDGKVDIVIFAQADKRVYVSLAR